MVKVHVSISIRQMDVVVAQTSHDGYGITRSCTDGVAYIHGIRSAWVYDAG